MSPLTPTDSAASSTILMRNSGPSFDSTIRSMFNDKLKMWTLNGHYTLLQVSELAVLIIRRVERSVPYETPFGEA
jgi:hypothetical protein